VNRDRNKHIRIEKIKLLYSNSLIPIILSAVASFFLVAALWPSADRTQLLIWLSITNLLAVMRIALLAQFKRVNPQDEDILKWEAIYSVTLLMVFLSWSLGLIWIMPRDNLAAVFILNTFSIGLAGAAISWYSPLRYLQMATISVALLPMIVVLFTLNNEQTFWVGIAACCMYVSCVLTSVSLQKTFTGNLELAYDLEKARSQAENLSHTDALTGLNNRRAFFDKAQLLFDLSKRNQQAISALMLDIDYFKKINDSYGHAVGDVALSGLARLLKCNLRETDLLCRFGGEEFVALLPNTNVKQAEDIANLLKNEMMNTTVVVTQDGVLTLTASFGVSDVGDTLEDLLSHADKAMYRAKNGGRNTVISYAIRKR
jgi:diguanylate cyclase (GGDEF)-like protein